jgi:hypothetical protein
MRQPAVASSIDLMGYVVDLLRPLLDEKGLIKLLHPDGRYTSEDVEPLLVLAMEGRRRVKEQLKRLGGLEFWNTRGHCDHSVIWAIS